MCQADKDGVKKGVVKLGFSWEARYVAIFSGEAQLAEKLQEMMTHPRCLSSTCVVQEWVDFDLEMRLYFLPPSTWEPAQKLKPVRIECNSWSGTMANGERQSFHRLSEEDILRKWNKDHVKRHTSHACQSECHVPVCAQLALSSESCAWRCGASN